MAAKYPLAMLPLEIWEMIILEVEDSADIRSLLKTSNQLSSSFVKINHLWLLDKVLPFLIPTSNCSKRYLDIKDLKNLRLVNKRWSRDVNAYLENQPQLRPYNKCDDYVNSDEHIWLDHCVGDDDYWKWLEMGRITFSSSSEMSRFHKAFKTSNRNPFMARSIIGKIPWDNNKLKFWEEMDKKVFQKHGDQIWFLRMKGELNQSYKQYHCKPDKVWKWIVNSFSSLPNLKGFHLDFAYHHVKDCKMSNSETKEFLQLEENQLPHLEFLESLKINSKYPLPHLFNLQLFSKYFLQLRRLQISIRLLQTRKKLTLPNLTELQVDDIDVIEEATEVFTALEAPQLTKLKLKNLYDRYNCPLKLDILRWISLFPSLLQLNVSCTGFDITGSGANKDLKVPLKYFKIGKPKGDNYKFLHCFPNLERLQICLKCSGSMTNKSFCNVWVWEVCPKLKTLLVADHFLSNTCREYNRDTYEKLGGKADPIMKARFNNESLRKSNRTKRKRSLSPKS